ncbi:MAG: DNA polymerase I, partial [Clostridia bacterium]|nr:DNA polymerase I [Clostridia bacterium]
YLPETAQNTQNTSVFDYVLPIKRELLDVGFFPNELCRVYREIFMGNRKVLTYNAKELMHELADLSCEITADFEDVAILKCISDGLANADSLEYCIDYHGWDPAFKAYGVRALYLHYAPTLSSEETKMYKEVELPLSKVLFEMERTGVSVNTSALNELSVKFGGELSELTKKIYDLAGESFNVNSTLQLGKILFEKLKIGAGSVKKSKTKDRYKTTAEELEKYREDHPIIPLVLRYRQVQKLFSTYVEGFKPLVKNGKVHTTYNQINTSTGRLSSSNPNLQNIPIRTEEGRELRKLFKASDGCVLIDADYSQIELRLLAHFSACKELVEGYNRGVDIHSVTASQVFGVALEDVTPQMRRSAKAVNFGIIYGMSAYGLSEDLGISPRKAQEYIDKYFESYSSVKNYLEKGVENAAKNGFTTTILGRRRVINELNSSNRIVRSFGERAAMNMPLQGSSADIIKIAMINVSKKLKEQGLKAKLVLQVHDELVIDCPEEETEVVSALLKAEMENAVSLSVPLNVDLGVGKTWYETK